jgi:predicted permease
MTATFLAAIFVCCFWGLANKLIDAAVFSILLGMLAGAIFCLPASGVAYIIPEEWKDRVGVWTGMMWTPCAPFALAGPPLAVITKRRYGIAVIGSWTGSMLVVAACLLLAALIIKFKEDGIEMRRKSEGSGGSIELGRQGSGQTKSDA